MIKLSTMPSRHRNLISTNFLRKAKTLLSKEKYTYNIKNQIP